MKWKKVKLVDICTPKQWKTISMSELHESGYPVYGANGKIGFYSEYTHEHQTIMITCRGATCGTINISEPKSYINGNAMALDRLNDNVDINYLYYFLKNYDFGTIISGSAQPQITGQGLQKLEIPIPPLSVQREIAEVLDRADTLRKKDQLLLQKYDELAQSIFYDMFGDPVKNEKGWEVKELGSLCSSFKYGTNMKSYNEILPDSVPVIRIPNVLNDTVVFENLKYSVIPPKELKNVTLTQGDLLFVRSNGNPTYIGRCAVYDSNFKAAYASYLIRSKVSDLKQVLPQFIQSVISNEQFRSIVIQKATTTAGNYNINTVSLKSLPIIVPPISLQLNYSDIYSKISQLKRTNIKNIVQSNDFFHKLVSQYLN